MHFLQYMKYFSDNIFISGNNDQRIKISVYQTVVYIVTNIETGSEHQKRFLALLTVSDAWIKR